MDWLHQVIGSDDGNIVWWQMCIRGVIVFLYAVVLFRMGGARTFGRWTPMDIVLAVLLGSALSRCLTGNAPFVPTLLAAAVLVALHLLVAKVALRWHVVGWLAKGRPVKLVENGELLEDTMKRLGISERDLKEHLRAEMHTEDLGRVKHAYLERGGDVSFVER